MSITDIKIGGLGGQGVILAGIIVGKASSIFDVKYATLTQSFGPEARGSACSAQVIVSDEVIAYPYVTNPNILVVMSKDAFTKFSPEVTKGGIILIEEDLVTVPDDFRTDVKLFKIPATRFAEDLGRKMVLNIVMVGFFAAVTKLVSKEAFEAAVKKSVPPGTEELNLKAFKMGYEHGIKLI